METVQSTLSITKTQESCETLVDNAGTEEALKARLKELDRRAESSLERTKLWTCKLLSATGE